jgi:hypothetical protein
MKKSTYSKTKKQEVENNRTLFREHDGIEILSSILELEGGLK